jgi:hypothetical protein
MNCLALDAIRGCQVFDRTSSRSIEFFAEEQDRKYQAASSGSDLENVYAQARNAAYVAFQNQLQKEVLNRSAEIGAN